MGNGGLLYYSPDFWGSLKVSKIKSFFLKKLMMKWGEMDSNNYFAADC